MRVARPKRTPRIATTFGDGATSDDVSMLIVEVGDTSSVAKECAERARERALDPSLRPDGPICCRASSPTIAKSLTSTIACPRAIALYLSPN
jgi:hypothetical protein